MVTMIRYDSSLFLKMFRLAVICALTAQVFGGPVSGGLAPQLRNRIVGGKDAKIDQFPFQVSLRYYGSHRCGGSIYKPNIVITAAHCVEGISTSQLEVVAGTTFWNEGGEQRGVHRALQNKGFSPFTNDYDVAILILDKPFERSTSVQQIDLATSNTIVDDGSAATISGWGAENEAESSSDGLKYVEVNIINQAECKSAYGDMITDNMICAGSAGKDACFGDSGGPMVVGGIQVGIISWGYGCAVPGYPGVYSRISALREWIDEQLFIFGDLMK